VSAILNALDSQQRAAAESISGPVVIHAGAGTGKTRTITHRLAHAIQSGVVEASQTLTVTFTNRAAGELRSRLMELGIPNAQVRTFHSAALRQLRFFYPQVFTNQIPTLISSKATFVAQAATQCHIDANPDTIRDIASEIEWAKVNIISPEMYRQSAAKLGRIPGHNLSAEQVAQIYETYLKVLDDAHLMDFEDVLLTTVALLSNYPELAAQVRSQYRYFTVDEFQDVSPIQFELLSLWLGNRDDVCVVGDPAQTIYEFTGATPEYLATFAKHFPRATSFDLTQSYRSTPEIIETANQVLSRISSESLRLKATRPSGKKVTIDSFSDDESEAREIASNIRQLVEGGLAPRDIAVIYRINSQSEAFETALGNENIPVTVRGASRFFERQEIRNALLHLRANLQAPDAREMNFIVRDIVSGIGWSPKPPASGRAAQETWESLNTLVQLADDFAAENPAALLPEFIAMLDHRNEYDHDPMANAVSLASIHAVKGLEWDAVFVAGLSDGLLPISYAKTPTLISQERRLFYVALTRAKNHLHLSWAEARNTHAKAHRSASIFLSEVADAI